VHVGFFLAVLLLQWKNRFSAAPKLDNRFQQNYQPQTQIRLLFMITFAKKIISAAVCVTLCMSVSSVWAEKADREKPLNANADALKYDDLKQVSVFTGNVIITKGTIIMRGGKVDVRQDPQGFQYATVTSNGNAQAYFKQKRENGVDEWIEGLADTIEYDGKADKVRFVKNANLKRLRGATLNDEIMGGLVIYDNTTDVYTVDGGLGQGGSGGRVSAVFGPKTVATSPAPTAQAPLRQSTTLTPGSAGNSGSGGDKK
jgi:lipopolysaccharide export system protein LptA